ncbi:MAG TPA: hypothetical protein VNN10_07775 [Dehalococcoidia bacterium]|nr:hypothetical protein [Dehalococcoidia bacterium]
MVARAATPRGAEAEVLVSYPEADLGERRLAPFDGTAGLEPRGAGAVAAVVAEGCPDAT